MCSEFERLDAEKVEKSGEENHMMEMMSKLMKNVNTDLYVEIFKHIDIFESTFAAARFLEAWGKANNELWQTLDFSMLKSDFVRTGSAPFVWVHSGFDNVLYNLLFIALNSSRGNIKNLIFHHDLYLADDQFMYTAKRCPLVRRLVFLSWNRVKKISMRMAIRGWKDLESMTMPSIADPKYVFEEISENCKNFRELKVMGRFHLGFAKSLTMYLPKLRVLSIRCSELDKEALILILDKLEHLQVLNISHSCFVNDSNKSYEGYRFISESDCSISDKVSRLREFLMCSKESCIMCQRTKIDGGRPRWFKYEEGSWKDDEVSSLAL
ncbi:unnamed protein product [Lathyrus sativus]|nr:unnamed protein product [Lathyrus sativus]